MASIPLIDASTYNTDMQISTNVKLSQYSTMRIGGYAKALTEVLSTQELVEAIAWARQHNLALLVLGGGSNIIFQDGFDGLVIINRIAGFDIVAEDASSVTVRIGAGENWDSTVARTVNMGLSGIEKLSFIPGTTGATPVQNVGAYGAEIADVFVGLEAFDLRTGQFVMLDKAACHFSYRNSVFKSPQHRRYIITSITICLSKQPPAPPFYDSLQHNLDQQQITTYTPQVIRDAVIAIRTIKLPDPAHIANTGSFFKNPIIPQAQFEALAKKYPDMPHWPMPGGKVKIAAGWLIDKAGLRGYAAHGMKIYEQNALVFVNETAKEYADLAAFRQEITDKVNKYYNIILEQEPELI